MTLSPFPKGYGSLVAVAGLNSMPQAITITSTGQQVYKETAAEVLKNQGIANPKVNLTEVIRVDLDGDGVEEVLVSGANYERFKSYDGLTPNARAGDYSLVVLRKVVQGKVLTSIITGEYYPKPKEFNAPAEHRVIGILEIVLSGGYYEGEWVEAYRADDTKITKVFSMGCRV